MFNKDSFIVKTWVKAVAEGAKKIQDVPDLQNLRDVVVSIIEGGE